MSWAAEELKTTNLGDKRRNRRLIKIVEDLSAMPHASVTQAARNEAAVQGTYEFWGNVRVEAGEILAAHRDSTLSRMETEEIVLAVQDTTELDFSSHPCKQGLGALSKKDAQGLKVHSVLCVSSVGVPLGVLHQKVWAREKNRRTTGYQDRKRAIEQKESHRWLESLELTQQWIPQDKRVVTVADREADIYELFVLPRREGSEFLIRACQPRGVKQTETDYIYNILKFERPFLTYIHKKHNQLKQRKNQPTKHPLIKLHMNYKNLGHYVGIASGKLSAFPNTPALGVANRAPLTLNRVST